MLSLAVKAVLFSCNGADFEHVFILAGAIAAGETKFPHCDELVRGHVHNCRALSPTFMYVPTSFFMNVSQLGEMFRSSAKGSNVACPCMVRKVSVFKTSLPGCQVPHEIALPSASSDV